MTSSGGATSCGEVVRAMLRSHCDGPHNDIDYVELFLDFDNAVPTEAERVVYYQSEGILRSSRAILADVQAYGKGSTDEIRTALQNPNDAMAQEIALNTVYGYVERIRAYYDLALQLDKLIPDLLWDLCSGPLPPEEQLDSRQALVSQLARLIDFVLDFDAVKMCTPSLQNDFSFYRRTMGREQMESADIELANQISLFLASPTPMLSTLSSSALRFVQSHPHLPLGNTTDTLATIVSVCRYMVTSSSTSSSSLLPATRLFCIRVMVGCLILFDHIDSEGAFVREAPINLRGVVQAVKEHALPNQVESLLNAIRYTSKHFNHASTSKAAKSILA